MLENIVTLKWALIISSVYAPPGQPEQIEYQRADRDFFTFAECEKYVSDTLALVDVDLRPFASTHSACILAEAAAPRDK
jgi:hypothetical protein